MNAVQRQLVVIAALALVSGVRCQASESNASPRVAAASTNAVCPVITAEQLRALIQGTNDTVVVDVRPKLYYGSGHIAGASNIPLNQISVTVREWPRSRKIVLYCKDLACNDSRDASRLLVLGLGFGNVRIYEGGIEEWQAKKYEVEGMGNGTTSVSDRINRIGRIACWCAQAPRSHM